MNRLLLSIVICLSFCVANGNPLPKEDVVKCKGMTEQQIFDYLCKISVESLGAEIASRDSTLLLAYVERRPQNCVAVIYTLKFIISKEKFSYAMYYGVTSKDTGDECQQEVQAEMIELDRRVRELLKI
ncbi:MAG: hypothetical protein MJ198_08215 [Bacteroidales bacterium]|nr:hypothetical protein [Bacteroidales bacterium]